MLEYVALTIRGETLSADEVTLRLQCQPTKAFDRGATDVHPTPTRFGYWRLRIDGPHSEPNSLLSQLFDRLAGRLDVVAEFARDYEVALTVVLDLTQMSEGEFVISPILLNDIAAIGAKLRIYWTYEAFKLA